MYVLICAVMLFAGGVRIGHFVVLGILAIPVVWNRMQELNYVLLRMSSFFDPGTAPAHADYQLRQSLIAVGSGGAFGQGFGEGRQQYGFLPYAYDDFIAGTIGEEWGFVGVIGVLLVRLPYVPLTFVAWALACGGAVTLVGQLLVLIGAFALASADLEGVAAFAGLIITFMVGISACTVYGQDGSAIWMDVVGQDEGSVRADVWGRQWGIVLTFLPKILLVSVLFVLLSGAMWAVPILLAGIPALLGAATGAALVVAAVGVSPGVDPRQRVGPNDAVGNISIHVWISMLLMRVAVLPPGAMVLLHLLAPAPWTAPVLVVVGLANGFGAAWALGRVTIGYLDKRLPDLFSRIRYGRVFRADDTRRAGWAGALDWFESSTLLGEQKAKELKQKQREAQRAKAGVKG
jgi:ABC-2 type transport system permease protein